ncbi:MAG: TonB-dependent receptor, partial [Arcobacteraceae bacterium]
SVAYMVGLDLARNEENKDSKYRVDYTGGFPAVAHTTGEVVSDTNSKENINELYGEINYVINDKIATTFNTRVDKIKYNYTNNMNQDAWEKDFTEYSYKLGATYKLKEDSIVYTNTSTGFRVPTLDQMYAGDMSTSTYSGTYTNNTEIKTEKTYNYEIGLRSKNDQLTYDISIYQINRDDVIGRSSGNYASTKGVDVHYDNMADVENKGLEFSLNTNNKKNLFFNFNYTYLDSKYTKYDEFNLILNEAGVDHNGNNFDGNNQNYSAGVYNLAGNVVPRTSKHTINLATNYRVIQNLLLTAEVNYRSSQYADELNRIKVDGYSVINFKTKYNTKISKLNIEFFAKINNAFDKQYYMMPRAASDRNSDGVYDAGDLGLTVNPGRSYLAGLSVKF